MLCRKEGEKGKARLRFQHRLHFFSHFSCSQLVKLVDYGLTSTVRFSLADNRPQSGAGECFVPAFSFLGSTLKGAVHTDKNYCFPAVQRAWFTLLCGAM